MNRYDRYPGDYLRDTLTLTAAQDGMYGRLIDYYYTTEKPIPEDDAESVTRCRNDDDRTITQWVLYRFFTLTPLGWRHNRIEREIAKARPRIEAARINGLRGGRPRQKPSGFPLGNPEHNPEETQVESSPSPSPSPSTKQGQKKKQPSQATASAFEIPDWLDKEVWAAFLEMRKKKRCPPTHRACALLIAELTKLSEKGHDPVAVLDQSILNSWTDVYPIKTKGAANGTHQPAESASGRAERLGNEHLARIEAREAERSGNDPLLAAHGRDLRA